ncbi:MAG: hypothetical protein DRJ66_02765 [Thermoprotei archaeon]|nr:MAG: hypothetical protein DRJ66_02765 [Thermoprotei archaeon]RLF20137.1 MAG: hypothetical protein DRZ82_03350 [Thermoprotei archaeon]
MSLAKELKDKIRDKLKSILDPELGLNIVEAGFIRDIKIDENGVVTISLMLTSPFCPLSAYIVEGIRNVAMSIEGVKDVKVNIVGFGIPPELKRRFKLEQ